MKVTEFRHDFWNIGFVEDGIKSFLYTKSPFIHWSKKKYKDRWFADPFILDYNDVEIIILAEEFCYNIKRGRLARVVFDRKTYEEKDFSIILDMPTHLSFPFIYRIGDKVYILPENSASGNSMIYEYNDASGQMKALHLVSDIPFTDATILKIGGKEWLLTTMIPDPNGSSLSIYKFDGKNLCAYDKTSTVVFSNKIARNAGEFFIVDGNYYRPAQDCSDCYGHGIVIQEINYVNGIFDFKNVNSFYPQSFILNQGIHTLNHYKDLVVVDGRGYRSPIMGRIMTKILKILRLR